ncbi:hypothetical protein HWV62_12176 [Athelia sp. TMB]|nr:hypothetical protein HWV62_12176 [Athelia sp. TMB]
MGKVTVYCPISGCSPEIPHSMWVYTLLESSPEDKERAGAVVSAAIKSLLDAREKRSQDDITVIGPANPDSPGELNDAEMTLEEVTKTLDESILVFRTTADEDQWDEGCVPYSKDNDLAAIVSYGGCIMVQTSALAILLHATSGRMNPRRAWRLVMQTLRTSKETENMWVMPGINYGDVMHELDVWQQDPENTPGMAQEAVRDLEHLGDEEKVKEALLYQGQHWIWMSPDRFPLTVNPDVNSTPTLIEGSTKSSHTLAPVEQLPQELLVLTGSHLPLISLLALASTSRHLRVKLLGTVTDRDALARAWIVQSGPWYEPLPLHPFQKAGDSQGVQEREEDGVELPEDWQTALSWDYLYRCLASASMRNRRRIWDVAGQLEKRAIELGI